MSTLGVVSDSGVSFVSIPVGQGTILSLRLPQPALHEQGFVCSHMWIQILQLNNNIMHLLETEKISNQNHRLKQQIKQQHTTIQCLKNDLQTLNHVFKQQKIQIQDRKAQAKMLRKKLEQHEMEKERLQSRYLAVLRQLQQELEEYKKKYNRLQYKIQPLLDSDSVRLKVLNEVESNHFMEINNLKNKTQTIKDENLKLRREIQLLKHALESERHNHDEELRRIKFQKNSDCNQEVNNITSSLWKEMETKMRYSYQQARKEAEYYKEKYFAAEKKYQVKLEEIRN